MRILLAVLQVAVALGLLNVWLVRARQGTAYRGGSATSMREEFAAYGLPDWFMYAIGVLKVSAAILLIVGLWVPDVVLPTALLVCVLMLGALSMHLKIGDPLQKSLPAIIVLALSTGIVLGAMNR